MHDLVGNLFIGRRFQKIKKECFHYILLYYLLLKREKTLLQAYKKLSDIYNEKASSNYDSSQE